MTISSRARSVAAGALAGLVLALGLVAAAPVDAASAADPVPLILIGNDAGVKDFRTWTRELVDPKFGGDMRALCLRAIPEAAPGAGATCVEQGGGIDFPAHVKTSIGAEDRSLFVRRWGYLFFDADLTKAGVQRTGPRAAD